MLKDFADLVKAGPIKKLIIENKHKGVMDNLILLPKKMDKVRRRNETIFEKLSKSGIII